MKRKPAYLHLLKEEVRQEVASVELPSVGVGPRVASYSKTQAATHNLASVAPDAQLLAAPALVATRRPALAPRPWKAELRLCLAIMKPITWVPVVWSFWCGAVAAGGLNWSPEHILKLLVGILLAGPLLCGMGQAINDWFDREVDAVNEPERPIASGQLTSRRVYQVIGTLGFFGLLAAYYLGPVVMLLAFFGIFMAHHYSAPPLRLKGITWLGPLSSAISYIFVPWLAAASVFGGITWRSVIIAGIYSLGGVGIMILNDFKSIRGDYQLKLPSVPVVYGTYWASRLACLIMDAAQLSVGAFLLWEGYVVGAGVIMLLLLPQIILQRKFVEKPLSRAIWYNARGQNFLVLGMLIAAWLTF